MGAADDHGEVRVVVFDVSDDLFPLFECGTEQRQPYSICVIEYAGDFLVVVRLCGEIKDGDFVSFVLKVARKIQQAQWWCEPVEHLGWVDKKWFGGWIDEHNVQVVSLPWCLFFFLSGLIVSGVGTFQSFLNIFIVVVGSLGVCLTGGGFHGI